MANTKAAGGGGFLGNLGKIYGGYTGGFIVFTLILAVLEQMGVPNKIIGYCFVILTIGVYAYIGILSRTMDLSEYYVAGRKVPALYNGMATGADWMSAASFISMAGGLYLGGYQRAGLRAGLDRRLRAGRHPAGALPAQVRPVHRARLPRHALRGQRRAAVRRDRAVLRVVHLHRRAVLRHRHHHLALPRHSVRGRDLRRPARHPGVLDAGRHARGDLDPGGPVHHPDHLLPRAGGLAVDQAVRHSDPRADLRPGARADRASSRRSSASSKHHVDAFTDAKGTVQLGRVQQLLGPGALPDDRHGLAAAHPDALLHDAQRPRGAQLGRRGRSSSSSCSTSRRRPMPPSRSSRSTRT